MVAGGGGQRGHLGRVLVVDDDASMRRACGRLLSSEGWTVVYAEHGRAAVDAMAEGREHFDCVISDINMPELDGFGLIREIRRHDDDLPILLMTGDPSLDGAVRAIDTGAVSYIAKPFEQETLASAVARAARRHGVERMRRRAESFAREMLGPMKAGDRRELEERFDRALAASWMAFQPIVDYGARTVFAYEALVRCDEISMRRPDVLIATAERLNRVHDLGRAIRRNVVRAVPAMPKDALIFVNVHGLELTDEDLFAERGPFSELAHRVVLEITERIGLDPVAGPSRVAMLRRLGYRIAVDDLGAGYAALGALATLEPEIVKLDMSLVRDLNRHSTKKRVVGAITTLVRELGGRVVAEGVETVAERDVLLDANIDLLQGYLFAKPDRTPPAPVFA
jgi:EAL domain-containing protein (putative c-di-GMP-specific phosphodiesterase class I)/CheY-like chemotaxis protein